MAKTKKETKLTAEEPVFGATFTFPPCNSRYAPGNAWNNVATGVNGTSGTITGLPSFTSKYVAGWGQVSGPTTITIQFSNDGFSSDIVDGNTVTTSGTQTTFGVYDLIPTGKTSARLKSSANVTATAQIAEITS